MSELTYIELFAGAGGLSRGLDHAGWRGLAHAEVEPHARAVLRHCWPDTPLHGDVSTLDGTQWRGVTLLSGGSPCQDLSVAGKRAGLSGRRSGLFFHQVRLWHESQATYCLWENVLGALSSREGKDFARVLSTFIGEPVAVPRDGKRRRARWSKAGALCGSTGVRVAWRVLDAQHFGVPQRRRRVFILGARAGGVNPAEVLSLAEGLRGDFATGREAAEGAAANVGGGVEGEGGCLTPWDTQNQRLYRTNQPFPALSSNVSGGLNRQAIVPVVAPTLDAGDCTGAGQSRGVIGFDCYNQAPTGDVAMTISGSASDANHIPVVFPIQNPELDKQQRARAVNISGGVARLDDVMGTLGARSGGREVGAQTRGVILTPRTSVVDYDARGNGDGSVVNTLAGDHQNRVTDYTALVFPIDTRNATRTTEQDEQNRQGSGIGENSDPSPTLTGLFVPAVAVVNTLAGDHQNRVTDYTARMTAFGEYVSDGTALTIKARDYKDATDLVFGGVPRRLTPRECERLMGWADDWTATGTDEQGREYQLSDTARYKLCGNGVASPVAAWIGLRLRGAIAARLMSQAEG